MPSSLASFFAPADSNEPPAHRNSLSKGEVAADGDLDSRLANILGSSGTSGKFSKFIIFTLSEFEILQSFFIIKILLKNKIIKIIYVIDREIWNYNFRRNHIFIKNLNE